MSVDEDRQALSDILDEISHTEHQAGRPLLSALVVHGLEESRRAVPARGSSKWRARWGATAVINYAPVSKLFVYYHNGHDYNCDGCANELGHTVQMLCATDTEGESHSLRAIVRLEHSYENDGFPILKVGRYSIRLID